MLYPCDKITYFLVKEIECYYCDSSDEGEECNSNHYGTILKCQMEDPEGDSYGNACVVGHTGNATTFIQ